MEVTSSILSLWPFKKGKFGGENPDEVESATELQRKDCRRKDCQTKSDDDERVAGDLVGARQADRSIQAF